MATSRKTARENLATLLEAQLVGTGKPVKTVSDSKVESLEGETPLVVVLSDGSNRERMTFQGDRATFYFLIQTWVLQSASGWTQAQAEDALDNIEALVAGTLEANQGGSYWEILAYEGRSTILEAIVAGVPYYVETAPVVARLARN